MSTCEVPVSVYGVQQIHDDQIPLVVVEAITPALLATCRLEPVPILLQPLSEDRFAGLCDAPEYTTANAVVLNTFTIDRISSIRCGEKRVVALRALYLHEVCHRVLAEPGHDARFLALLLVLYTRANATRDQGDYDLRQRATLYDSHDHFDQHGDGISLSAAIAWAWDLAEELAPSALTAAECASSVKERYSTWLLHVADDPIVAIARKNKELNSLRVSRWGWSATSLVVGLILGVVGMLVVFAFRL